MNKIILKMFLVLLLLQSCNVHYRMADGSSVSHNDIKNDVIASIDTLSTGAHQYIGAHSAVTYNSLKKEEDPVLFARLQNLNIDKLSKRYVEDGYMVHYVKSSDGFHDFRKLDISFIYQAEDMSDAVFKENLDMLKDKLNSNQLEMSDVLTFIKSGLNLDAVRLPTNHFTESMFDEATQEHLSGMSLDEAHYVTEIDPDRGKLAILFKNLGDVNRVEMIEYLRVVSRKAAK